MVKKTIIVTEKVLRETVKAEQGLPIDLTLPKYANDKKNYEVSFKKNSGAGNGTTVSYTSVPASGTRRRLSEEGSSKAEWTLVFEDGADVTAAKDLVGSKEFSNSISASTGMSVTEATASVATVEVEVKVEKDVFVLVDDIDTASTSTSMTTSTFSANVTTTSKNTALPTSTGIDHVHVDECMIVCPSVCVCVCLCVCADYDE